jgi:hypothetical protein
MVSLFHHSGCRKLSHPAGRFSFPLLAAPLLKGSPSRVGVELPEYPSSLRAATYPPPVLNGIPENQPYGTIIVVANTVIGMYSDRSLAVQQLDFAEV